MEAKTMTINEAIDQMKLLESDLYTDEEHIALYMAIEALNGMLCDGCKYDSLSPECMDICMNCCRATPDMYEADDRSLKNKRTSDERID